MWFKKMFPLIIAYFLIIASASAQTGGSCIENAIVTTRGGATALDICQGDGLPDIIRFKTKPAAMPFAYLITDTQNFILGVSSTNIINLEGYPVGTLRVWAFSYLGGITVVPGQHITDIPFASICSGLSSNFVTINSINPNAGLVSTIEGVVDTFLCVTASTNNTLTFTSSGSGSSNYGFVVTDNSNIIVGVASNAVFDFSSLVPGLYRVYGVAFGSTLQAPLGFNINSTVLSSTCFGISTNFVRVLRGTADGGSVSVAGGASALRFCRAQDVGPALLSHQSSFPTPYVYLVTNIADRIIAVLPGAVFSAAGLPLGDYRIRGLAYSGTLLAQAGDDIFGAVLSSGCFDVSDNFIPLTLRDIQPGSIQVLGNAPTEFCTFDGFADVVSFTANGQSGGNFGYLITDAQTQTVLGFSSNGQIDFDFYPEVQARVWGIVYTGTLTLQPGQTVDALLASLPCAFLSENAFDFQLVTPRGGIISLVDGSSSTTVCVGDGIQDQVSFSTTSAASNPYIYVVTDGSDNVLGFSTTGTFDVDGAGSGFVRVYGISYSGNLLLDIGDRLFFSPVSDGCFNISDNFAVVFLVRTDAGDVSISGGGIFRIFCTNDGRPDQVVVTTNTGFAPNYVYVLADENNRVISVSDVSGFNFEGTGPGLVRIYGLAFTGNLLVQPGDILGATSLSDACFGLSGNFVLIQKEAVQPGTIQTTAGGTALEFCSGDGLPDIATFMSSTQQQSSHVFLITDNQNSILAVEPSGNFDFETLGAGNFRIWSLSYTGNLSVDIGASASTSVLSDRCYAISGNFIQVTVNSLDAGFLRIADTGESTYFVCGGDGLADIPAINSSADNPNASYVWLITTELNEILSIETGLGFDMDRYPTGRYRIWGLAFEGNLLAQIGQVAGTSALASACYALSRNFIAVEVSLAVGGEIGMLDGGTAFSFCLNDQQDAPPLALTTTGMSAGGYVFVMTSVDGVVRDIFVQDVIVFGDDYDPGQYRIWGLSYSGSLTLQVGDNIFGDMLSTGCFQISENAIPITADSPSGAELSFDDGSIRQIICPAGPADDIFQFQSNTESALPYVFLLTDTSHQILRILDAGIMDFNILSGLPEIRVIGLSYAGALLAQPGDRITEVTLASDCYELSRNFLTVVYMMPQGGTVSASNQSTFFICEEALNQEVQFNTSSLLFQSYVYLVTDNQNRIIGLSQNDRVDFSVFALDSMRVWGLSYTGNLTASLGLPLFGTVLSDDCFSVSGNFVRIYRTEAEGGFIFSPSGQTAFEVCTGDGVSNLIQFSLSGQSSAAYIYLITDEQNFFIGFTAVPSFDFENATQGVFRIYGLSYTGIFQLFPGDNIFGAVPASSGCFDFSDNFLEVRTIKVDGGTLSSSGANTTQYICIGDGIPDVVSFSTTSAAPGANFVWVFTNQQNLITGLSANNSFDFNIAGRGITRVWGLSYTGNFLANFGDTLTTYTLTDECYDLSTNFLTIVRDTPNGGDISTSAGETEVNYCQGVDDPELQIVTNSSALLAYTFVLTDVFNEIIAFSASGLFDLSELASGTYRIWGLSYAGILNGSVSNLFDIDLGSSCLEISSGFVTIHVSAGLQGGVLSANNGNTEWWFCPTDGISDLVEVTTTSTTPGSGYKFLVTNANGMVLLPDLFGNAIDFQDVGVGEYRIYGVAFSGNYQLKLGDNIFSQPAASQCFQFSDNFIRVISSAANGGTLATLNGETTLLLNTSDGIPDSVQLVHTGTPGIPYIFVFTDLQNRIIDYSLVPVFDLEGRPESAFRIWGLSWYGPLPEDVGIELESLLAQDNCADLSENAILVTTIPPVLRQLPPSMLFEQVTVYPNPAVDFVTLEFNARQLTNLDAEINLLDVNGRLLQRIPIPAVQGAQGLEIDIRALKVGQYIIRFVSGADTQTLRLLKMK